MAHLRRFYLPQGFISRTAWLDTIQSHHLQNVLRLKRGAQIEVFNQRGESYLAEIVAFEKAGAQLKILGPHLPPAPINPVRKSDNKGKTDGHSYCPDNTKLSPSDTESSGRTCNGVNTEPDETQSGAVTARRNRPEITLATAIPKGKRMDNLVAELAALGLKRLIPLSTQRSVVKTNLASPKFTRWKRIVIESVKQSQGNHLMEIIGPRDVKEVINQAKDYDLVLMGILHVLSTAQYSVNSADYLPEIIQQHPAKRNILYLIGPEGDFTPEEVNLAMNAGIKPVILPVEGILRIETAVVAMLVMLLYAYYPQSLTG